LYCLFEIFEISLKLLKIPQFHVGVWILCITITLLYPNCRTCGKSLGFLRLDSYI